MLTVYQLLPVSTVTYPKLTGVMSDGKNQTQRSWNDLIPLL
jgi:hypothetical protein